MRKGKEASENFALYLIPTFIGNDIAILKYAQTQSLSSCVL